MRVRHYHRRCAWRRWHFVLRDCRRDAADARRLRPEQTDDGPDVAHHDRSLGRREVDAPVENASVYIKYVEERKVKKNKTVELNVKTNRDGTAHVPDAPMGRALVQVVADGWKTYGRWYDVTDPKQTIKIHLDKPPKWY